MNKVARIGKQVAHHSSVDINSIKANFSSCNTYRYTLTFDFKSLDTETRTKKLTIILKNPSSANEQKADQTINRVQQYVFEHFKHAWVFIILVISMFLNTLKM